ncbi:HNH endonuclease [Leisingera sp. D0M16]|uniref:HNH endonuclease n=1 Tax=Leisingera coralii TaxID=3351347 RepID=UPI003B7D71B8
MRRKPIHSSIKARLGYDESATDDEVYDDWKGRLRRVCKPCWELKYCPYGPLVEQSPILPGERKGQVEHTRYLAKCLETGTVGSLTSLTSELREDYEDWLHDEQLLISQVLFSMEQAERFATIAEMGSKQERLEALLGSELPPIHVYRVEYDGGVFQEYSEEQFPPETWREIQEGVERRKLEIQKALETGQIDNRQPLEPARREMFLEMVKSFDPESYPEEIPQTFHDGECTFFGHICPVFFAAEAATETQDERRIGRRHLKFETMMRIVRRDDYRCQHCKKKLQDDEVEFDHKIPVSKGGSSEEHNMRLTCFDCNRDKSDSFFP